ncbi:MAG: protein kinase [Deltaproteobacteria bacterium]|nr:protein kinase [Deltaproteobacteria bacterium]
MPDDIDDGSDATIAAKPTSDHSDVVTRCYPTVVTTERAPEVDAERPRGCVVLEEIGRGGMGSVRRAHDPMLRRDVAMKVLDPRLETNGDFRRRFLDEARINGQLQHPNIVPIHELGLDDRGAPHFTMKLVRGRSFESWLAEPARPPGSPERLSEGLEVFTKICDAISYAHSRGVIHRDLKPGNVMVGEFGEVYVVDWGVALVVGTEIDLGREASPATTEQDERVVGTPTYMPPEQALGGPCDARTDVFGLGAILYQIVTGHSPYGSIEPAERMKAICRGQWVPISAAAGGAIVAPRLARIIHKALAADPAERHASAAELRGDVQRFLRGGFHLPRRTFAAGERIVVEGDVGDCAYLIVRGECVAYKGAGDERRELRRMTAGDVFGEMAVISNVPRTATVEAADEVTAVVIGRGAIYEHLGVDTWVGALFKSLVERFRALESETDRGR